MVYKLNAFVSFSAILILGSAELRAGINPDLPLIELPPSEVCEGVSYVHPGEMKEYAGTRSCVNLQDHRCQGAADDACYVTAPYQAVAKSAIDAEKIKEGVTIGGVHGTYSLQSANPPCMSTGQSSCQTSSAYPAMDSTLLIPGNIKSGHTLFGIAGSYTDPTVNCSNSNREGCYVTSSFVAVKKALLKPENIKSNQIIGGVLGAFPSATYPLASPAEADLTPTNFYDNVTSAASFGFFDAYGQHYTMTGQPLTANDIAKDVTVFNITGTAEPFTPPDFNHLRLNPALYGGQGKLKLDCRNAFASGHDTSASIYPSVDDASNTEATNLKWGADKQCGQELWENVTPDGNDGIADCTNQSNPCVYRNTVTQLMWLNDASKSKRSFNDAKNYCEGFAVEGLSDWRLPTHRELLQAYVHGLRYVATDIGFVDPSQWYWTSSSRPASETAPEFVIQQIKPADGNTQGGIDITVGTFNTICVHY